EPVGPFSGGEKARLVLALVSYQRPNLLLLDEPTNHLDLEMRQALAMALQEYEAAVVLVSHDRHLLRAVADDLLLVDQGRLTPFDGDLDDYARWFTQQDDAPADLATASTSSAEQKKQRKREEALKRNRLSPLRAELGKIETRLATLETRRSELEARLAQPELYESSAKQELQQLLQQQADLKRDIETAEGQWLAATEALEEQLA